jgi:putative DNA primase/helicase
MDEFQILDDEFILSDDEFKSPPSPYRDPTYPAPTITVLQARGAVKEGVGRFFGPLIGHWTEAARYERAVKDGLDAEEPLPPAIALNVGTGIGKSRDARHQAAGIIRRARSGLAALKRQRVALLQDIRARRRGGEKAITPPLDREHRTALKRLLRGIVAVPRHDLGDETARAFHELGLKAVVWRGREADAPNQKHLTERKAMCLDLGAVKDALRAGANVSEACCAKLDRETGDVFRCPFFDQCQYQQMLREAAGADILIVPHELLFNSIPSEVGRFGFVVIDEGFWQKGLRGLDGRAIKLTVDTLTEETPEIFDREGNRDDFATNDLVTARAKLARALRSADEGPLNRKHLVGAGLTVAECGDAKKLEWKRITRPNITPGMDPIERKDEADRTEHSGKRVRLVARLWSCVADLINAEEPEALSGRLSIGKTKGPDGPARAVTLRWRDDLSTRVTDLPILHLDATMRAPLVRAYLPRVEIMDEVQATMPFVTVRQVYDRPFSAHMLITRNGEMDESLPAEKAEEKRKRRERDNRTRVNHAQRVLWYIRKRAREFHGKGGLVDIGKPTEKRIDVLVVCQQDLEHLLPTVGTVPDGVETAHHNAVAGADRWKHVACLIVIGRTLPGPDGIEARAGALSGMCPVSCPLPEKGMPWYDKVERGIRLADGSGLKVGGDQHPDPLAEDVRWSICEGELLQIIGRPRGVLRTEADPLQIDILTDVCLPVTVDEAVEWRDVVPTEIEEALNRGAVLTNSADMTAAFPDLWPNHKAARNDRGRSASNAFIEAIIKANEAVLSTAIYQPAGSGQKPRTGWFDLSAIPDPSAWLTEKIGPLARCEITEAPKSIPETTPPVEIEQAEVEQAEADVPPKVDGIDLTDALSRLAALSARLEAAKPVRIDADGKRWIGPTRPTPGIIHDQGPAPAMVPVLFPVAAPGEVDDVTEFRIGNRALRSCGRVIALGIPEFGPVKEDNLPPVIGNGGCSDEVEDVHVPFDYGPADRRFERYRQTPDILRKPLPGTDLEEIAV